MTGVAEDAWLAGLLGKPAYRVDPSGLKSVPKKGFAYAKIDAGDVATAVRFQDAGFKVVDVSVTFSRKPEPKLPAPQARVAPAVSTDREAILSAAGSCFKYSRFHLDPQVPEKTAHAIKRSWIESYFDKKRGDALYAVYDGKTPAGFLAVLVSGGQSVIDLIGVDARFQGRGFGRDLVRFFVNEYAHRRADLLVGTQAANVPSMRLYESCGFSVARTALVLHRHA